MNPRDRSSRPDADPPDRTGRSKRAAGAAGGDAYQGAFEAVMAVLVGAGFGYWVDARWETTPVGVIAGVVVGFAAMVLRLLRLGRELVPESKPGAERVAGSERSARPAETGGARGDGGQGGADGFGDADDDRGPAEMPALSDIWGDDAPDGRD